MCLRLTVRRSAWTYLTRLVKQREEDTTGPEPAVGVLSERLHRPRSLCVRKREVGFTPVHFFLRCPAGSLGRPARGPRRLARRSKFSPRRSTFSPRRPKFSTRRSKFSTRRPKFSTRRSKFSARRPKFSAR